MLTHHELTARMTTYADALMAESLEYEKAKNRQAILRSRLSKEGEDDHKNLEDIKKIDTKIQKLIRSSTALWRDFEATADKRALQTFSMETADLAVMKAQNANCATLHDLMSHIKLWHTVVISQKHALKSVKDCLYGMEPAEFHPDNLKQDAVTLKKSLIERKHNLLADISD